MPIVNLMAEHPLTRLRAKSNASVVRDKNDSALERALSAHIDRPPHIADEEHDDHKAFWDSLADDLDTHARELSDHSRKATRLAETVRTIKITKKVAGRVVPNSTHYIQTITRKSDTPFRHS